MKEKNFELPHVIAKSIEAKNYPKEKWIDEAINLGVHLERGELWHDTPVRGLVKLDKTDIKYKTGHSQPTPEIIELEKDQVRSIIELDIEETPIEWIERYAFGLRIMADKEDLYILEGNRYKIVRFNTKIRRSA